jgi:hypothetical protein
VKTVRCAPEMELLGDRHEVTQMAQVQFARASYRRPINRV